MAIDTRCSHVILQAPPGEEAGATLKEAPRGQEVGATDGPAKVPEVGQAIQVGVGNGVCCCMHVHTFTEDLLADHIKL